jgi:hypothetical protein
MAYNPKSLQNLNGSGHNKGQRQKLTKAYVSTIMDYLMGDLPTFLAEIESLSPKDRVATKLKMMDMILPKDFNLQLESDDENTKPSWTINFVAPSENKTIDITPIEELELPKKREPIQLDDDKGNDDEDDDKSDDIKIDFN